MKEIKLRILAKDVHNSGNFMSHNNCVVATAAKRQFKTTNVQEGVLDIDIDNKTYDHERYGVICHNEDVESAKNKSPNVLIRELILTPL